MTSYEQTIFAVLREIALQRHPDVPEIQKDHRLTYDLGLRSLDLAQLVATLELELRADPFAQLVPITSVRTVGDVCEAYRRFFDGGTPADSAKGEPGRIAVRQRAGLQAASSVRRGAREQETS
jgi:acyl carrier protein